MPIIISLGGSVIINEKTQLPDTKFLKEFINLIKSFKQKRFIIVCGGGTTARNYMQALKKISNPTSKELDLLGIEATLLNATLLKLAFKNYAHKTIAQNPTKRVRFKHVLIAAGWLPGHSTDYDAVLWAKTYKEKQIINITCVDMLHDKDPRIYPDAKPIPRAAWKEFFKIINSKWHPGMKAPFDPIASRLASKLKLTLILVGRNIENLRNLIKGKAFKGSIIE
ncbi:UMP kinase [Candidatus Woesearchaeota archaeon]|nr:UMP kinase [Candidatus Woesearchaeota archaeon]RLE40664.1 MAG: UMP kinase [Candidatus Woesearchaeota archaeon]